MRTKSSVINLLFALIGQIIGLIVSFVARIVFIQELSTEYLGLNGLFTNILGMLSLVELGIGPALTFSLYKPLAEKNTEQVKSLMRLYKKAYINIGILILLFGIGLTPYLNYFVKNIPDIPNIQLIFMLFVINASISYFYSYKRSLIISDQKRYIATMYRYTFFTILTTVQIIVLLFLKNYVFFLLCQIIFTIIENILVSRKVDELYPYINEKNVFKIDKLLKKQIFKNVRAMTFHKIGGVVVNSTDSILISKFVGIIGLGIYSNYQLIINALNMVISQVFSSVTASIGNLGATETETNNKKKEIFNIVLFINFWIYGYISISLMVLINPFIELWIGRGFTFSQNMVIIIVINFYLSGMRKGVLTFRDALGVYWHDRFKPLFESIINLVGSLYLVQQLGIIGVFIGTTLSTLTTCFWIEPYILYKYGFKSSALPFFRKYALYTVVTFLTSIITLILVGNFKDTNFFNFIFKLLISTLVPNVIFFLVFHRTSEFRYLFNLICKLLERFSKRKSDYSENELK